MSQQYPDPPLTEDTGVPCLFVTGAAVEVTRYVMRVVGWVLLPEIGGETEERRIVVRFAMPLDKARVLMSDMQSVIRKAEAVKTRSTDGGCNR